MEKGKGNILFEFRTRERLVGTFLVITLFILTGAIVFISQGKNWFKQHVRYHTFYKEGYNLNPGSKVTLYNTKIGKVVKASLTEDNRVRVDISVLAEYASKIREDSIATVKSPTIIGSEYIAVTPGTQQKSAIPANGEIASKEKKALADYLEEFKVEEKLEILTNIVQNINEITTRLKDPKGDLFEAFTNIREISTRLKDPDGHLFSALENISKISASLNDPNGGLLQTLDNLASISQRIEKGEGSAGRLIVDDDLYFKFDEAIDKIDSILDDIKIVTARMPALVDELGKRIKEVKDPLAKLDKSMDDVPEIMNTVRGKLDDVSDIIESVKESFLIKGNLPKGPEEKSISPEGRGE